MVLLGGFIGNMIKGFPDHTNRNLLFFMVILILLSLIKRLQLFTGFLPVRHIMMRLFKHTMHMF